MVVLVFVRVRSGASAQLSGALSGDYNTKQYVIYWLVWLSKNVRTALCQGGSSRPMVARLVRYGPVRQTKTFLDSTFHSTDFRQKVNSFVAPILGSAPLARRQASKKALLHVTGETETLVFKEAGGSSLSQTVTIVTCQHHRQEFGGHRSLRARWYNCSRAIHMMRSAIDPLENE